MKRLTKWEIAVKIENLPGNTAWGANSMMTLMYDRFSRQELVEKYNNLVYARKLNLEYIQ